MKQQNLKEQLREMTPREIKEELDKYVVGQQEAKKKVSIALRHRVIRKYVPEPLCHEITPKNILMIGPTGVGKTEIVKRLSQLLNAPFIKVEATKFTEVGYVGRDVESIIRDLVDKAVKMYQEDFLNLVKNQALEKALDIIVSRLKTLPELSRANPKRLKKQVLEGKFDDYDVIVEVNATAFDVEIMAPPGMEEMTSQLQSVFQSLGSDRKKVKSLTVADAKKILQEEEAQRLMDEEDIKSQAIKSVEENGIVFIDELDKVCQRQDHHGSDVSREGVQRDLLPLIEGCTVSTKYGPVKTDHILFITSGAFHLSQPSDLIPELQGRLPVRVELHTLSVENFIAILSETQASLVSQYKALLAVEGIDCHFTKDGIAKIAQIASDFNEINENIGARRLHTVMERLLEDVFYTGNSANPLIVDEKFVTEQLKALISNQDHSRFIL